MNAKKAREKNRRRARRLAEQAWEAADDENIDLAIKIIRRAIDLAPGNPQLWNDRGLLYLQLGDDDRAVEAFQACISLAPDFAESYAHLAAIRVRQGYLDKALLLQREAVELQPDQPGSKEQLKAIECLLGNAPATPTDAEVAQAYYGDDSESLNRLRQDHWQFEERIDNLNWSDKGDQLTRRGHSIISRLLDAEQCRGLRELFHADELFARTVTMAKSRFGSGAYRYFDTPIPKLVDAVRQIVYRHLAPIANHWEELLRTSHRYPESWCDFRNVCARARQLTPSPLMLRYEAGGFNALHQDLRGEVYFPIQLVIILSPNKQESKPDGFEGGRFLFSDFPQRKPADCRAIDAGLGDAVLFCTRARLVKIAGVYGLKSVKHGMDNISSGVRYALGIPFHDFE